MRSLLLSTSLVLLACGGGSDDQEESDASAEIDSTAVSNPVVVMTTTMGDLVVELYPQHMPNTVANYLGYVDADWYDNTLIHRVVDDWVIQGGGYTSGLVPKTPGPAIELETSPEVLHVHGAISMARNPADPDSATSQWFICDWPEVGTAPHPAQLDGSFAAFGVLIEGFDVLESITQVATTSSPPLDDVPVDEIVVTGAYRR